MLNKEKPKKAFFEMTIRDWDPIPDFQALGFNACLDALNSEMPVSEISEKLAPFGISLTKGSHDICVYHRQRIHSHHVMALFQDKKIFTSSEPHIPPLKVWLPEMIQGLGAWATGMDIRKGAETAPQDGACTYEIDNRPLAEDSLLHQLPSAIKSLRLFRLPLITGTGLRNCLESSPSIRELRIFRLPKVTAAEIQDLQSRFPDITILSEADITKLFVKGTILPQIPPQLLSHLPFLRELVLWGGTLNQFPEHCTDLSRFSNLQRLFLSHLDLEGFDRLRFPPLLESLHVWSRSPTALNMDIRRAAPKLNSLSITGENPVTLFDVTFPDTLKELSLGNVSRVDLVDFLIAKLPPGFQSLNFTREGCLSLWDRLRLRWHGIG